MRIRRAEEPLGVRLVLGEEPARVVASIAKLKIAERRVRARSASCRRAADPRLRRRSASCSAAPDPGVAKPERRQHVQARRLRPAIRDRDPDQNVVRSGLRVLDEDIEIALLVEDARCRRVRTRAPCRVRRRIFRDQPRVGKLRLRILVERRACRNASAWSRDSTRPPSHPRRDCPPGSSAEEPLLQNRIVPIPKRQREAEPAFAIADARAARPRPSDRRGCAPDRAGNNSRHRHWRNNPRAPSPTAARRDTAPSVSSSSFAARLPRDGDALRFRGRACGAHAKSPSCEHKLPRRRVSGA